MNSGLYGSVIFSKAFPFYKVGNRTVGAIIYKLATLYAYPFSKFYNPLITSTRFLKK